MTNSEIQEFISSIHQRNSIDQAYIGFFQYGGGPDESFIKANRQGLELYAAQLLSAGIEIDKRLFEKGTVETFGVNSDIVSDETEIDIHYIELKRE